MRRICKWCGSEFDALYSGCKGEKDYGWILTYTVSEHCSKRCHFEDTGKRV